MMKKRTKHFYQKNWLPNARKKIDHLHAEFDKRLPLALIFFRPSQLHNTASILALKQEEIGEDAEALIDKLCDLLTSIENEYQILKTTTTEFLQGEISQLPYLITADEEIIEHSDKDLKKRIDDDVVDFLNLLRKNYNKTISDIRDELVNSNKIKYPTSSRINHVVGAILLIGLLYLLFYFDVIYWDWKYSLHLLLVFFIRGSMIDYRRILLSKAI